MIGTIVGERYKISSFLGGGGFSQTFLAIDLEVADAPMCVVKKFQPSFKSEEMLKTAKRLFRKEAEILQRLGQHDQIPTMMGFFETEDEFFLVQEYVEGHPISAEIGVDKPFSEADALALLDDMLGILAFVHEHRVIHRDIKPDNLIRRRRDGRVVLIDFGAVKERHTELENKASGSGFTVGIGTQGYMPSEQSVGRPELCSDIYALGVTVVHAVTGVSPWQMERSARGQLQWFIPGAVGDGFAAILDGMIQENSYYRYQSVTEIRNALNLLSELPTAITEVPIELKPSRWRDDITALTYMESLPPKIQPNWAIASSIFITVLILGLRWVGFLQPLELLAFDALMRMRPAEPKDDRITVLTLNRDEREAYGTTQRSLTDENLIQLLDTLDQYQPIAIGFDIYLPDEIDLSNATEAALANQLSSMSNLYGVCKAPSSQGSAILPSPGLSSNQVGFSDFVPDRGSVIRRQLITMIPPEPNSCPPIPPLLSEEQLGASINLQLALHYLQNLPDSEDSDSSFPPTEPMNIEVHNNALYLADTEFLLIGDRFGGYQNPLYAGGQQVLLNYRAGEAPFDRLSLSYVLDPTAAQADDIDVEALVHDRIVLIGVDVINLDAWIAPIPRNITPSYMPGVEIHAHMTSQLISAVLDQRPLIWIWPLWGEMLWISGWSVIGGVVVWWLRSPLKLSLVVIVAAVGLTGFCWIIFSGLTGWLPLVPPLMTLVGTVGAACTIRQIHQKRSPTTMIPSMIEISGLDSSPRSSSTQSNKTRPEP